MVVSSTTKYLRWKQSHAVLAQWALKRFRVLPWSEPHLACASLNTLLTLSAKSMCGQRGETQSKNNKGNSDMRKPHTSFPTGATRRRLTRLLVGSKLKEVERDLIFETLACTSGNRTTAARMLGFSVRTMRNKLAEYSAVPSTGDNDVQSYASDQVGVLG